MKLFLSVIFVFLGWASVAQDSTNYHWKEMNSFPLDSTAIWTMDVLQNQFIDKNSVLTKKDSSQSFVYEQSIKSWGATTQIVPINAFKVIQFSEEQQTVCYFDNTLTETEDCLDLSEYNIINAKWVARSAQQNKIWVFDNMNSTLLLVSLNQLGQSQEVRNLNGLLSVENVVEILESNNRFYIADSEDGVFMFDIYGTLLERFDVFGVKSIQATEEVLMIQTDKNILMVSLLDKHTAEIPLPIPGVQSMLYRDQQFFFRTKTNVHKFSLEINQ